MLGSYGSIFALGHKAVAEIMNPATEVEVTEKIDGSQISFGVIDGELCIRSKNQKLHIGADNGMFNEAVNRIMQISPWLHPEWVYRGEYLMKPKHNTLCYNRVPKNHIAIFDIEKGIGTEDYLFWHDRKIETERLCFEPVPIFIAGTLLMGLEDIKELLERESILGGTKVEGVVIKAYNLYTEDKKIAKAKFVSPAFKEKHEKEWGKANPSQKDIIEQLIESYRHEGRWRKAVQHLREDGVLEGSPRDIGPLMKVAQQDLLNEEEEAIKEILFNHFKSQIARGSVRGLPDWFKMELAEGNIEI